MHMLFHKYQLMMKKKLCHIIPDEKPKLQLSSALIKKQSQFIKKTPKWI